MTQSAFGDFFNSSPTEHVVAGLTEEERKTAFVGITGDDGKIVRHNLSEIPRENIDQLTATYINAHGERPNATELMKLWLKYKAATQ